MAGTNQNVPELTDDYARKQEAARRSDLANAAGIIVMPPMMGQDKQGVWRFGIESVAPHYEWSLFEEFEETTTQLVRRAAETTIETYMLPKQGLMQIASADYKIGPDAESWPQYIYNLYEDISPIMEGLGAIETLLAIGSWAKQSYRAIRREDQEQWKRLREDSASQDLITSNEGTSVAFTQGSILALCVENFVFQHGVRDGLRIDSYPRGMEMYVDTGHPGPRMTYLVRIGVDERSFIYHMESNGVCLEHYLLQGGAIKLQTIPELEGSHGVHLLRDKLDGVSWTLK